MEGARIIIKLVKISDARFLGKGIRRFLGAIILTINDLFSYLRVY